jgi:hypothetical protein
MHYTHTHIVHSCTQTCIHTHSHCTHTQSHLARTRTQQTCRTSSGMPTHEIDVCVCVHMHEIDVCVCVHMHEIDVHVCVCICTRLMCVCVCICSCQLTHTLTHTHRFKVLRALFHSVLAWASRKTAAKNKHAVRRWSCPLLVRKV